MPNGTYIADLAREVDGSYEKVGAMLYFRTHDCKVRLDKPTRHAIGKFIPTGKVPEAPMIEGDLFHRGEKVGHIHSQQNEYGDTLYWLRVVKVTGWLNVKLEDK